VLRTSHFTQVSDDEKAMARDWGLYYTVHFKTKIQTRRNMGSTKILVFVCFSKEIILIDNIVCARCTDLLIFCYAGAVMCRYLCDLLVGDACGDLCCTACQAFARSSDPNGHIQVGGKTGTEDDDILHWPKVHHINRITS
jgi:hypothetical protein